MVDLTTLMAAGKAAAELKALIVKSGKNKPDAVAALSLVSQLQEQIDGLRAQVLELQSENLDLKKKNDEREAWEARTRGMELIQAPGGAWVYARHGKPPYFCPTCYDKPALSPLQPRLYMGDCSGCNATYYVEPRGEPRVPVMQRRQW